MPPLAANPLLSRDFLLAIGLLLVVLLGGAVVLWATDRYRKRRELEPDSPLTLNSYHELYEAGELTDAEYAKVRDRLAGKGRPKPPAPPPAADPAPPAADQPPP